MGKPDDFTEIMSIEYNEEKKRQLQSQEMLAKISGDKEAYEEALITEQRLQLEFWEKFEAECKKADHEPAVSYHGFRDQQVPTRRPPPGSSKGKRVRDTSDEASSSEGPQPRVTRSSLQAKRTSSRAKTKRKQPRAKRGRSRRDRK